MAAAVNSHLYSSHHHQLVSAHGDQRLVFDEEASLFAPLPPMPVLTSAFSASASAFSSSPIGIAQNAPGAGAAAAASDDGAAPLDCCEDVCPDPFTQPMDVFPGLALLTARKHQSSSPAPASAAAAAAAPVAGSFLPQSQQAELSLPTASPPMTHTSSFPSLFLADTETDAAPVTPPATTPPAVTPMPALAFNPWASSPPAPVPAALAATASAGAGAGTSPRSELASVPLPPVFRREVSFELFAPDAATSGAAAASLPEIELDLAYAFETAAATLPPAGIVGAGAGASSSSSTGSPSGALNFEFAFPGSSLFAPTVKSEIKVKSESPVPASASSPPAPTSLSRVSSGDSSDSDAAPMTPGSVAEESVPDDASYASSPPASPSPSTPTSPSSSPPVSPAGGPVAAPTRRTAMPVPMSSTPLVYADSLPAKAARATGTVAAAREARRVSKPTSRAAASASAAARKSNKSSESKSEVHEVRAVPAGGGPPLDPGRGPLASVGLYTREERREKIERYKAKRVKRLGRLPHRVAVVASSQQRAGPYACRKSFAERRPRVGGRFVKMDEETKKYLSLTKPGAAPAPADIVPPPAIVAWNQVNAAHAASSASSTAAAQHDAFRSLTSAATVGAPSIMTMGAGAGVGAGYVTYPTYVTPFTLAGVSYSPIVAAPSATGTITVA